MKFNRLEIPKEWQEYWTKYPHGYTIIEAITSWVNETNPIIDRMNYWEDYLQKYVEEIDGEFAELKNDMTTLQTGFANVTADFNALSSDFISLGDEFQNLQEYVEEFDENLQGKVEATLSEWQASGFLEVVINAALESRMDDLEDQLAEQTEEFAELENDITTLQTGLANVTADFNALSSDFNALSSNFTSLGNEFQNLQDAVVLRGDLVGNVMDYGAAADGTTDDSGAFNAAFAACRTVLIPAGEYKLNQPVTIPSNTTVIGEKGNNITLEMCEITAQGDNITIDGLRVNFHPVNTSDGASAIRGTNCRNLTIRNCQVYCNERGNNGIAIDSTSDAIIKNNMVFNTGQGHGIAVLTLCDNILIEGNTCRDNGRCGISVYTDCSRVRIIGNSVENFIMRRTVTDGGIDTYGPNVYDIVIQGNIVKQEANPGTANASGIRVSGVTGATVTGNTINIAGYVAVGILVQGRHTHDCEAITVANNAIHVTGRVEFFFRAYDFKDLTISGNVCRVIGNGSITSSAIETRSRIDRFSLLGNSFSLNNTDRTFYVESHAEPGGAATIISGNFVEKFAGDSFVGFKSNVHIITNNTIYSNHTRICHIAAAQRIIIMGNYFTASGATSNHITGSATIQTVKEHNIHTQI